MRQCDNAGVVATSHRGLSLKQPMAGVLQSLALLATRYKVNLSVAPVAGVHNAWADDLSRGTLPKGLDPRKRLSPALLPFPRCCLAREVPSTGPKVRSPRGGRRKLHSSYLWREPSCFFVRNLWTGGDKAPWLCVA